MLNNKRLEAIHIGCTSQESRKHLKKKFKEYFMDSLKKVLECFFILYNNDLDIQEYFKVQP
jgi:hypothetical protein